MVYRQLAQESLFKHQGLQQEWCAEALAEGSLDALHQCGLLDRWSLGKDPTAPDGRCCWVDASSHVFFDESELLAWLETVKAKEQVSEKIELFEFDHIYPGSVSSSPVAILYSASGASCFRKFHLILAEAAERGHVRYVLRPVLASGCKQKTEECASVGAGGVLNLGGYGVELALKNMEYKAIDDSDVKKNDVTEEARTDDFTEEVRGFIFSKLLERKPALSDELMAFRDHLLSSSVSDTMNVWELKDLGYQAAQRIVLAADPLRMMQDINQNFPSLVSSISRLKLNQTIKDEIVANQRMVNPGKNLFAINGALVNIDDLDLFSLIELVLGELSLADVISKMKVPSRFAKSLIQIPDPAELSSFRVDFRSEHVHYLNNLEEDAMYRRWRSNLQDLLMPVFPGKMHYIRKNLFHAVYILDPVSPSGLKAVETILYYYENGVPMRFGVILISPHVADSISENGGELPVDGTLKDALSDLSSLAARLFFYVKDNYGAQAAFQFLSRINEAKGGGFDGQNSEPVELTHIEEAFFDTVKPKAKSPPQEILLKFENGMEYKEQVLQSTLFVYKLGLHRMHPCLLMNGLVYGSTQVQGGALAAMNEELPKIQEGVYFGHINSNTDILDKFLREKGYPRYNSHIVATSKEDLKYVSLAKAATGEGSSLASIQYLHSPATEDDVKPVTHLLCIDVSTEQGVQLLIQAVRYLINGSKKGRVGIFFNVGDVLAFSKQSSSLLLVRTVMAALKTSGGSRKVLPFLHSFLLWYAAHSPELEGRKSSTNLIFENALSLAGSTGLKLELSEKSLLDPVSIESCLKQLSDDTNFVSSLLGLQPKSNVVVTNGKVFILNQKESFVAEDFLLLESVEYDRRAKPVAEVIEVVEWEGIEPDDLTSDFLSSAIMVISSAIAVRTRGSDTARFEILQSDYSAIIQLSDNATVHVDAIIDPLSSTGQKLTPLLLLLQQWFQTSMRILLNPMNSLADLPLKNFYRFVIPGNQPFNSGGGLTPGPMAVFSNMPPTKTLTMNLDVPEPWLVEPIKAIYDLDNIVLEKLGESRTMYAVFELEALMLTGHCHEQNNGPPRGLQLLLGTKLQPHMVDTTVMANLGYWQLKAAPGVWTLSLAPGKSSEIYTLHGPGEGEENGPVSKQVVIKDLGGELLHLEVVKRKGKENEAVLGSDEDMDDEQDGHGGRKGKAGWNQNLLKWATDLLGGSKQSQATYSEEDGEGRIRQRQGETINIFSIASGHLYERFLKIMMLSVLKNTRRPVKFWFIKNYLSPQFKDFIPHMAKEYGFEYDLVTYKWPTWLHKQTEKQRIIWAYKILFLDVIFPLSLRKVIFVDADQIVRADMGELYDMDLKSKPLAYTPFCDNNKEMDGYRFWNQGFWKDHLRGRPYHISALYVVDLVRFRQTAAGDTLRVFYETLSKDPGSLSNLDQDLPNYAQHQVPIFSLPQEWLWCESWCGNATKSKAKTIDLCNNPMTKEPKLQGAKRIVPEWLGLDEEARELTAQVMGDEADPNLPSKVESKGQLVDGDTHQQSLNVESKEQLDGGDTSSTDVETAAEL